MGVGLIWAFLILFLIYPLGRIFYDAVTDEAGRWTLANFHEFFTDRFYLRSLVNSMILGVATVFFASVLGIAVAFLLVRYDFAGRDLFSYLTMIPIISPPLVGVLGFTFILGRAGTVNVLLMDLFDMLRPVNFLYGLHGVVLVETLHLFPMITLNVVDALGKVDPSLEEAAESVGARGWSKLWRVTLPLTTPGYVAGALLVFIWTFSDFATPLVLGVQDLLAPQAYLNIVQFVDRRIFRMGIVISALMVLLAILFLLAARHYVAIKDYSSLSYSTDRAAAALARPAGAGHRLPELPAAAVLHPLHRGDAGLGGEGLGADPAAGGLHAPVLRARDRGDAEVHREQLSLLRARGGDLHRGGRAHRVAPRAVHRAGAGRPRRDQHPDPGRARHRDRHRVHPRVPLRPARLRPRADLVLDRHAAGARGPAPALHGARLVRLAAAGAPLAGGGRRRAWARRARAPSGTSRCP